MDDVPLSQASRKVGPPIAAAEATGAAAPRIAVGIATAGRPQLLRLALTELGKQTRAPEGIIVSAPSEADVELGEHLDEVRIILGARGLTRQRNAILRQAQDFDVVVFFDDDFFPEANYLAVVEEVFRHHPDVAMMTGSLIADGIIGPGIPVAGALDRLHDDAPPQNVAAVADVINAYGCNMAVRLAPARVHDCRFDETLPLYGWLEDVDFSRQLAAHGRIVKAEAARGVHLGIKQGRQSGLRLGYSQIANPVYLMRKGTCPWRLGLALMGRNLLANCCKALRPEPYVDRLGRARGNFIGFFDLLRGRLDPQRITEF